MGANRAYGLHTLVYVIIKKSTYQMIVSIIGRPNVGKSTLFNRIAGERISIVSNVSGTTRDRISTNTSWNDKNFILIDTGGIDKNSSEDFQNSITDQALNAIKDSDKLIFMVDGREGINPLDEEVLRLVRKNNKKAVIAINKLDLPVDEFNALDFSAINEFDSVKISAYHNRGIVDLLEKVLGKEFKNVPKNSEEIKLSIVGHPNVGKSSLFNLLTESNRSIVSNIPGTTRDSIDYSVKYDDKNIKFIDTAGLRRRGKIEQGIEKYSSIRTIKSVENADVCALVLSAEEMITAQDLHISGFIKDLMRPCIILMNKFDLVTNDQKNEIIEQIEEKFDHIPNIPILLTSALNKLNIEKIIPKAIEVYENSIKRISQKELNSCFIDAISRKQPSSKGKKTPEIFSISQYKTSPPGFKFESTNYDLIHFSYKRYLENQIRNNFDFSGCPISLRFVKAKRR
ncbi:MAG: ribosome biogenesis GTPase Der [Chloroflexi bacterium]|nr:ribosome biogenesis GTPase Der [Chloroflexota bacterium]